MNSTVTRPPDDGRRYYVEPSVMFDGSIRNWFIREYRGGEIVVGRIRNETDAEFIADALESRGTSLVSRGYVLPPGWLPIEELTVETIMEYRDRPHRLMFLVDFIDEDGIDHSGTMRTLSWLHELILRVNRSGGLIEVSVIVDARNILDVLHDEDCGFVAYRIAEPLERVEG